MNAAQAIAYLFPDLDPLRDIHEASPNSVPNGAYFVISDLTDGQRGLEFYVQGDGRRPQQRELTLLITLYGAQEWKLADLRPTWERVRAELPDLVTDHPGYPPLRGVRRGAVLPPTPDSDHRRPYAGMRLHCTYIE